MKITHPGTEISKPGYLKQRMKLNPEAIKFLYQNHNKNFYSDPEITPYLYKEHLVFAVDGSDINIPTTPENLERFGTASRKGTKPHRSTCGCRRVFGTGRLFRSRKNHTLQPDPAFL